MAHRGPDANREARSGSVLGPEVLRTIMDGLPVAVFVVDAEGRPCYANLASHELLGRGVDPAAAPEDLASVYQVYRAGTTEPYPAEALPVLRALSGETCRVDDIEVRHPGGRVVALEAWAAPVPGEDGAIAFGVATFTDVSDRKRVDEALRRREEELAVALGQAMEASRLKSEFLATMSHEIRTPMNGVIGMTSLLLGTELSPEQREFTETVHNSGNALLGVINDILDFSKIEAGRVELENIDFDLRTLVEEVGDLLAERADDKAVELAVHVQPEVPVAVRGDPGRVRQVLINLVGNAVKFTDAGEIVVRVGIDEDGTASVLARFEVCDTGIGIPLDAHPRLFESFSQSDASSTRRFGGTGLGLAISKRLAELMGGGVGMRSEVGKGSTFWFTARLGTAPGPVPEVVVGHQALDGQRVLVADDNATNREILEQAMLGWGMRPTSASAAADALHLAEEAVARGEPYDAAVLDLHMPGMDGVRLAQALRRQIATQALPVVLLTSSAGRGDTRLAREAGVDAYLTKPVHLSALREVLATVAGPKARSAATPAMLTDDRVAQPPGRERGHVLVVEDNVVNQKVAVRMLERLGYHADVAINGLDALEAMSGIAYDLVLMDCQMPEMDGYQATAEIRRREAAGLRTPIVAVTAAAMKGDDARALEAGMDAYLTKPVSFAELAEVVERWARPVS